MLNFLTSLMELIMADGLRQGLTMFTAFAITWLSIPSMLSLARAKKLYDEPGHRTSHSKSTPNLGGISIFASLIFSVLIFGSIPAFPQLQYVIAGLFIIFFVGLKDDIIPISPWKKLYGQILAAFILIILGQIRITNLHGIFGIYAIDPLGSIIISFFVIIVIVNSINLVDGIDGLASGLAIVAFSTFGGWFFLIGAVEYSVVAAAMVGSLIAFFYFNVFSKKNKIFMGDTGSLIIGFVLAAFFIRFNELNIIPTTPYHINAAPVVALGILMIPLFDTFRLLILRTIKDGTPFRADRNHLHHLLLNLNFSHLDASLILITANLVFILGVFKLQFLGASRLLIIVILAGSLFDFILHWLVKRKNRLNKTIDIPVQSYHPLHPIAPADKPDIKTKPV